MPKGTPRTRADYEGEIHILREGLKEIASATPATSAAVLRFQAQTTINRADNRGK